MSGAGGLSGAGGMGGASGMGGSSSDGGAGGLGGGGGADFDLADNEWRLLTPNPSQRYADIGDQAWPNIPDLTDEPNPTSRCYGGMHYGDGKIFYFGGGHGCYAGNDVETYDIANNIWRQSYRPEVCP